MVESTEQEELKFDDLIQEDDAVDYNGIRDRQHSCYAKDLRKEETPDFLLVGGKTEVQEGTITKLMYVGIEDEDLTKYKERLLGDLSGAVRRAT